MSKSLSRMRTADAANRHRRHRVAGPVSAVSQSPTQTICSSDNALLTAHRGFLWAAFGVVAGTFLWAYWPTWLGIVRVWETQPDYSHGYFVVPVAAYILWARRDTFPGVSHAHRLWPGCFLLLLAGATRYAAARYYLEPLDGWSMLVWLTGIAWLLGGWRWARWSLPAIAFLSFMIPLPYRVERWMSEPLQGVATQLSTWCLQCLGLPALSEGNTILLGARTMEVEQACSGLRIFVGIAALAFAFMTLTRRGFWQQVLLAASVLPIALLANSARIVTTGMLYEFASDESAQRFSHDLAGWLMLPLAALMFAATLWYVDRLFPRTQILDVRTLMSH